MFDMGKRFLDEYKIARRLALFVTLYLTYQATMWSMDFASYGTGINKELMIAAVMAPLGLLQGAIFKFYNETRRAEDTT